MAWRWLGDLAGEKEKREGILPGIQIEFDAVLPNEEFGGESMSEQEKSMLETLAEKASQLSPDQEKMARAYAAGLADGARSVQSGEKAG